MSKGYMGVTYTILENLLKVLNYIKIKSSRKIKLKIDELNATKCPENI